MNGLDNWRQRFCGEMEYWQRSRSWVSVSLVRNRRHAFSLIELLVVLGILTVILAVSLPVLHSVFEFRRRAKFLSNLRSNAQVFAAYTGDWSDRWPCFTQPGFLSSTVSGAGISAPASYFDAHILWPLALVDSYYAGDIWSVDAYYPPGADVSFGTSLNFLRTAMQYPCAFIADPAYWDLFTRTGPSQFGATSVFDVTFPSEKSLLVQEWPFVLRAANPAEAFRTPLLLATTDGSALAAAGDERISGIETGDGYEFNDAGAVHFRDIPPLLHTKDGVHGRDIHRAGNQSH